MKNKLLPIVVTLLVAFVVGACGSAATPSVVPTQAPPAAAATQAPAQPQATVTSSGPSCDFDAETCAFLAGKRFDGQSLVVGVWGGEIETILRTLVIPPLEARGASVSLLLGGTGDRFAQIYAEKGNPTMDIAYLNISESQSAVKDGVVEPPSADVPAYNDLYPVARTGCYGMSVMGTGIDYNTDVFKTPPQWADLWNPQYKGKIGLTSFPGNEADALIAVAARLAGTDEHNPDAAFAKIAQLKPFPMVAVDLDTTFAALNKGDIVAIPDISGYAMSYIAKGYHVGFSFPTDAGGTPMTMDQLCVVKGIKNRGLALAWTELALSPKVQEAYATNLYFGPTNSLAVISPDIASQLVYGPDKINHLLQLDWTYFGKMEPTWVTKWNQMMLGK